MSAEHHRFHYTASCLAVEHTGNLHSVLTDQHILWLHVPMKVAVLMHVSHSLEYLEQPVPDPALWEGLVSVFHGLVQVAVKELKHEVQLVIFPDDLLQLDYTRMIQLP